jgi:hypothetical protein
LIIVLLFPVTLSAQEKPMKKLKLDLAQIRVLSFEVKTAKGSGTVNAHGDGDVDVMSATGITYEQMSCASSCPEYYCFDANTNPDFCGNSLAC